MGKEIEFAISNNKTIIPVVIDNSTFVAPFDFFFTSAQIIPGDNMIRLVDAVCGIIGVDISEPESDEIETPQKEAITEKEREIIPDFVKNEPIRMDNPVGDWFCSKCGVKNNDDYAFCKRCGNKKPSVQNTITSTPPISSASISSEKVAEAISIETVLPSSAEGTAADNAVGDWFCSKCGVKNNDDYSFCKRCGNKKPSVQDATTSTSSIPTISINADKSAEETIVEAVLPSPVEGAAVDNAVGDWFCSKCGVKNNNDYAFCKRCGNKKQVGNGFPESDTGSDSKQDVETYIPMADDNNMVIGKRQQKEPSSWTCHVCGTENSGKSLKCIKCSTTNIPEYDPGLEWVCTNCTTVNPKYTNYCSKCHKVKSPVVVHKNTNHSIWVCPQCGEENSFFYNSCQKCLKNRSDM